MMKPGRVTAVALAAMFVSACSSMQTMDPGNCAMVGAAVGGLGGTAVGANVHSNSDTEDAVIGTAIGAAAGAVTGYALCALMGGQPEAAPPPPPPPPPPAPKPKPQPVVKKKIVLPGVSFALDKAELVPEAQQVLDREVVQVLKEDSGLRVVIEGHTDATGSAAYNQKLSERRAKTIKAYLVQRGISVDRIKTVGYGESRPVATNDTREGRARNRRAELKVLE